ncbi:PHP domain-containing protein [Bacillus sp. 03113]|uniref:PHP domain-containing protein n=1 Tax=Bacillus sp. 03113 TaxID=2578211 RepID=UPI0011433EBA|nr:PHP domain-containing protein [Bacillus sp. 03113]
MKIDLHMHTTCSDGELTPKEILHMASQNGVSIMSITDHDDITAFQEAKSEANKMNITLIPGIELNTNGPNGELHILGFAFHPDHPKLLQYISWRKQERVRWSKQIVLKLQELGYEVEWENCFKRAAGGVIVRTHIADELVAHGYFISSKKAFNTLLVKGQAAFVERSPFSSLDAIRLIHQCGGKAFIAHPGIYPFKGHLT